MVRHQLPMRRTCLILSRLNDFEPILSTGGVWLRSTPSTVPSTSVAIDRILPRQEFLDREGIAGAGLFQRQQTAAHGGDHLGLAADDPALGMGRRQIRDRERTSVRPDDVLNPRAIGLSHVTLTNSTDQLHRRVALAT